MAPPDSRFRNFSLLCSVIVVETLSELTEEVSTLLDQTYCASVAKIHKFEKEKIWLIKQPLFFLETTYTESFLS